MRAITVDLKQFQERFNQLPENDLQRKFGLSAWIAAELRTNFKDFSDESVDGRKIFQTNAAAVLLHWLNEFVKNSLDARATKMEFKFAINSEHQQVEISIIDNGQKTIPTDKIGIYNIAKAFSEDSEKKHDATTTGGKHRGLAYAAFDLEAEQKTPGNLKLLQNFRQNGATVILTSSSEAGNFASLHVKYGAKLEKEIIEYLSQLQLGREKLATTLVTEVLNDALNIDIHDSMKQPDATEENDLKKEVDLSDDEEDIISSLLSSPTVTTRFNSSSRAATTTPNGSIPYGALFTSPTEARNNSFSLRPPVTEHPNAGKNA